MRDIAEVLESKSVYEPTTGCLLWTDCADKNGYGKLTLNYRDLRAHRVSFQHHKGELSDKDLVCHKCDTPACINPDHLFIGTPLTNMQDKVQKGRLRNQYQNKTHCKHGHELNEQNVYWGKTSIGNPKRICIACHKASCKRHSEQKRIG